MRRRAVGTRLGVAQHEAVAVADARIEAARFGVELPVQEGYQLGRLGRRDLIGGVIDHRRILERPLLREVHEVAAEGHVVRRERDAHAHRLERRAAAVVDPGVVAHHRKVGGVRARRHSLGDGARHAHGAVLRKEIHMRLDRRFERGPAAELGDGAVRHAVAKHYHIFHTITRSVKMGRSNAQPAAYGFLHLRGFDRRGKPLRLILKARERLRRGLPRKLRQLCEQSEVPAVRRPAKGRGQHAVCEFEGARGGRDDRRRPVAGFGGVIPVDVHRHRGVGVAEIPRLPVDAADGRGGRRVVGAAAANSLCSFARTSGPTVYFPVFASASI